MNAEPRFFQIGNISNVLAIITVLTICSSGNAATRDEQDPTERELNLLQKYKLVYPHEIFAYCISKHGIVGPKARGCMVKQNKLKKNTLKFAQEQLGRRSLAQNIYDDCLDYYPASGVERIRKCVNTRLVLRKKLGEESVEEKIYQACDFKWRKHNAAAVDNCSRMEANYYRDKGKLRN